MSRAFVYGLLIALFALGASTVASSSAASPRLHELDAVTLRDLLASGAVSAVEVTQYFLRRINEIDDSGPTLNAVIEINPDALAIAERLDRQLAAGELQGALHGIPVLLKENIDTNDAMQTRAGSLALEGHRAKVDARLVQNLRAAGAIVLGKTNLSEWANMRGADSTSGWSSAGGQTKNPYVLDRNPCGSSSGSAVAVAAGLAPLAVGTETDGSIVCPSGVNGVVGIKPTIHSVSQQGIIPIAASFDVAGPMAKTVRGAVMLLNVMLEDGALSIDWDESVIGRRVGVLNQYLGAGELPAVERVYDKAANALREMDAILVDPVSLPLDMNVFAASYEVMEFEFEAGIAQYLAEHGHPNGLTSLDDLIRFNNRHADTVLSAFGQEVFVESEATPDLPHADYETAVEASVLAMRSVLSTAFEQHQVEALLVPVNGPAWKTDWLRGDRFEVGSSSFAAVSGYPSVVLPMGFERGLPLGVALIGQPGQEARLVALAALLEAQTQARRPPTFRASLEQETARTD